MRYVIGSIITLLLLVGCAKTTGHMEEHMNRTEEQIKFSTVKNETIIDQQPANKAKEIVASFQETTEVYAVNSKNQLLVAFHVRQMDRFQLEEINKKIKKSLKNKMNEIEIEVSSDEKIILELDKLESDLQDKNMSNQSVEKKIKKLISLSKEET